MGIKNWQLVALIVGSFAAIVAIDILIQYNTSESFRDSFPKLSTAQFAKHRATEMIAQEMTVSHPSGAPTFDEPEEVAPLEEDN